MKHFVVCMMAFEIKGHKCSKILMLCVPFLNLHIQWLTVVFQTCEHYTYLFLTVTEWIFLPPISYIYIYLYFKYNWYCCRIVICCYLHYVSFLLFNTFKHNSSSSTQFLCTFMLQKFYWNVSVHSNLGYYRTKVMDSLHKCFKAQMHPPETACQIHVRAKNASDQGCKR